MNFHFLSTPMNYYQFSHIIFSKKDRNVPIYMNKLCSLDVTIHHKMWHYFYVFFEGTDWPPLPPSDYDLLRAQPFAFQRGRRGEAHFVQAEKNFPSSIILAWTQILSLFFDVHVSFFKWIFFRSNSVCNIFFVLVAKHLPPQ